jgi:ATP-dependent DNA helicase RecG
LECKGRTGLVLFCEIEKTPDIRNASDGIAYLRRGAQNLPQDTAEKIERLKYSKGIISFEDQKLNTNYAQISNSLAIIEFALEIIPTAEPDIWLKKQHLIVDDRPTVAGAVLFSDEPQVNLPKAAIKVYRYKTRDAVGTRDTLAFNPLSIEGNAYKQIYETVALIKKITEEIPLVTLTGLEKIEYPTEAIHEVVTNAVIHRDYSINDDIHVRIFDNRIEVASPGTLPAHVTVANILDERFARNPKIVRILNKFRNPPNKDVGEGLNTAFEAMRKLKLKDPLIEQRENSVVVALRHEQLGTPEQIIVDYLRANDEVNNAIARGICFIGSENSMKRIFQKMITSGLIKRVPNRPLNKTGYVKGRNFPK